MSDLLLAAVAHHMEGMPVVFVGGAVVGLHLDELRDIEPRPTEDVDCVIAVSTRAAYHGIEEELRARKFTQPFDEPGPICRWRTPDGIKVDVMPTDPSILGFTSGWYVGVASDAVEVRLSTGINVHIAGVARLFAMKADAYRDRGCGDPWGSKDLEDIVALVAGCSYLVEAVGRAPATLEAAIRVFAAELRADDRCEEFVAGHCPRTTDYGLRVRAALNRLGTLAS